MDLSVRIENKTASLQFLQEVVSPSSDRRDHSNLQRRRREYANRLRDQLCEVPALVPDSVDRVSSQSIDSERHKTSPQQQITLLDGPRDVIRSTGKVRSARVSDVTLALPLHSGQCGSTADIGITAPTPTDQSFVNKEQREAHESSVLFNSELKASKENAHKVVEAEETTPTDGQRARLKAESLLYVAAVIFLLSVLMLDLFWTHWYGVHRSWNAESFLGGFASKCFDPKCNPPI